MGAKPSKENIHFLIERQIAANLNCNNEVLITIGVLDEPIPENSLRNQAIRIGDSSQPIYKLNSFKQHELTLTYEFDSHIVLSIIKTDSSSVWYTLITDTGVIRNEMDPVLRKYYTPMDSMSNELDMLESIIKLH